MVSAEENGKSKTYKTYRNLDIEYNKRKKRADREIKDTDSVKKIWSPYLSISMPH